MEDAARLRTPRPELPAPLPAGAAQRAGRCGAETARAGRGARPRVRWRGKGARPGPQSLTARGGRARLQAVARAARVAGSWDGRPPPPRRAAKGGSRSGPGRGAVWKAGFGGRAKVGGPGSGGRGSGGGAWRQGSGGEVRGFGGRSLVGRAVGGPGVGGGQGPESWVWGTRVRRARSGGAGPGVRVLRRGGAGIGGRSGRGAGSGGGFRERGRVPVARRAARGGGGLGLSGLRGGAAESAPAPPGPSGNGGSRGRRDQGSPGESRDLVGSPGHPLRQRSFCRRTILEQGSARRSKALGRDLNRAAGLPRPSPGGAEGFPKEWVRAAVPEVSGRAPGSVPPTLARGPGGLDCIK